MATLATPLSNEENLFALDTQAALDDDTLATIREEGAAPSEGSELSRTGSGGSADGRGRGSRCGGSEAQGRTCLRAAREGEGGESGCFQREAGPPQLPTTRGLRRDQRLNDDLGSLPVRLAKECLLGTLRRCDGEPRAHAAAAAVAALAREQRAHEERSPRLGRGPLAATRAAAGKWRALTRPIFPGALPREPGGRCEYPLGRMSFGLFGPADVVVAVERCANVVAVPPTPAAPPPALVERRIRDRHPPLDPRHVRTYDVETTFVVVDPRGAGLRGALATRGFCAPAPRGTEAPDATHRLDVWFVGGDVAPLDDDEASLHRWRALFGAQRLPPPPVAQRLLRWALRVGLGIEATPRDDGCQSYSVSRPMLGHVDVLYADADLRATRGNRGTLVVMERAI